MSRAWLPMRFPAAIPLAAFALLGAAYATPQANDPQAVQIIGGDSHADRCVQAVMGSDITDRAINECTRALRYPRLSRPGEQQLLINRGVLRMRRGEFITAIEDFDHVVRLNERNAEAHLNRGVALIQLRRHGEAIAAITEAMGLGVMEPHKAYFNRAAAREALGDVRGAYEDYSTALEIRPDWGPANAELARFARTRRDHLATVLEDAPAP